MRKPILVALAVSALFVLTACSTTPHYDAFYGDAVRQNRIAMTADPAASSRRDPVAGMDGLAAKEATTRYLQTFKEPPPVVNVINIGGAIGTGSK